MATNRENGDDTGRFSAESSRAEPATTWTVISSSAAVLTVVLAVFVVVGGMAIAPINAALSERKSDIDKINLTMAPLLSLYAQHANDLERFKAIEDEQAKLLPRDVHSEFAAHMTDRISTVNADLLRDFDEITHQVHTLEGNIVNRSENEAHWAENAASILALNSRIDAIGLRLNSFATAPIAPPAVRPQ